MPPLVLDTENSTPHRDTDISVHHGEAVGESTVVMTAGATMSRAVIIIHGVAVTRNIVLVERSGTSVGTEPLAHAELDFWFQKQAFEMLPRDQLAKHEGMFIACKDGVIVDSDETLEALTDRFFTRFGDVSVYMIRIDGDDDELRIDTPFFE